MAQFTLHFTKVFTTGTLLGLAVSDRVSFPTAEQCHQAVEKYQQLADRNRWYVGGWAVVEAGQVPALAAGVNEAKTEMEAQLAAAGYDEAEIMIVMSVVGQLEAFVQSSAWDQQMSQRDRSSVLTQIRTAVSAKLGLKALEKATQPSIYIFWQQLSLVEHYTHLIESTRQLGQADVDGQPMWLVQHGQVPAIQASLPWVLAQ